MDWPVFRLDELFDIARGGSPRPIKSYLTNDDDGVNWIKISDASASGKYITETKEKIRPEGISKSRLVRKGDFLLSNSMSFGRPYIMGTDGCIHDGWLVLSPKSDRMDQDFLFYLLGSPTVFSQFDRLAAGSTVRNLNISLVSGVKVPLPSLEEQKRIVAMLDEAFADIDKARELTEQNLKNTRELFESYLHHQLTPHNDWCVSKLGEVSEISYGYTDSASYEVSGPKFLRITDIKGGSVDWGSVPFCQISSEDYNKHKLKSGDIVFARTGATTGKSYLVENPPEAVAASYLIRVRLDQERVNPRYVRYFFETRNYWDSVNAGTSGSAQGGFNASKLANLEIYFPTELDTQDVLIEKLEIISRMIEDVNKAYLEKLKNLNELKSGLFSKVFSRG